MKKLFKSLLCTAAIGVSMLQNCSAVYPSIVAAVGATLGSLISPCIYSKTHYSTPRNPIENNIIGETDERVNEYNNFQPIDYSAYINHDLPEKTINFRKEIGPKIDEILKEMEKKDCKTDYEKALFLHDYIYDHCTYDYVSFIKYFITGSQNFPFRIKKPHGCLIDGKAVCVGITNAYSLLLNTAGVPCKLVFGYGHCWNIVKINGYWYHVDVTFDLSCTAFRGKYSYFMLTEKELAQKRTIYTRTSSKTPDIKLKTD